MSLTQATLQDAYDHMFGSGALSYSWLLGTKTTGVDFETRKASDEWSVEVTCENGDGGETTVTVDPAGVLRAARKVIENPPGYASRALVDECSTSCSTLTTPTWTRWWPTSCSRS